jgi:hypothetical protein
MSEDRQADDQGDGVDAAVSLSQDVLAELVGPFRASPPRSKVTIAKLSGNV